LTIIPLSAFIWMGAGCGAQGDANPAENQTIDSARIATIEAYIKTIDSESFKLATKKFSPNFYGPKDGIGALYKNGQLVKVTIGLYPQNQETRDYYYFDAGKMVLARSLEWVKAPNPSAKEVICFLGENTILLTKERTLALSPGQNPSPIFNQPTVNSIGNNARAYRQILSKYGSVEKVMKGSQ